MTERRGGWPGPRKVQKVVPQHPDQVVAVQTYADLHGINYAEAMRRLVDAGLSRPGARVIVEAGPEAFVAACACPHHALTVATDPFTGLPVDRVEEYDILQAEANESDPEEGACG